MSVGIKKEKMKLHKGDKIEITFDPQGGFLVKLNGYIQHGEDNFNYTLKRIGMTWQQVHNKLKETDKLNFTI